MTNATIYSSDRLEVRSAISEWTTQELFDCAAIQEANWHHADGTTLMGDEIYTFDWMSIDTPFMAELTRAVKLRHSQNRARWNAIA